MTRVTGFLAAALLCLCFLAAFPEDARSFSLSVSTTGCSSYTSCLLFTITDHPSDIMKIELLEHATWLGREIGLSDPAKINWELIFGMVGVLICSVVFVSLWTWAASSKRYQKYRIHIPARDPLAKTSKFKQVSKAVVFDITLYILYLILAYDWLIHDGSVGLLTILIQVLAILLIYDFMFYWVHRLFHHPFLMRHVHGVHHKVRFPKAVDDFFLHPVDSLWVTTLFFLSIAIVGPLSTTGLIVTLFVYVFINNSLHSGLNLPHPLFTLTNYLARRHEVHHGRNVSANFGSIFPFWDIVFGTNVRP